MSIVFVFPGQGSQSVGMLADLAEHDPIIEATFQEASDVLGFDLWALVKNGPAEDLNRTQNTQPALLTASVALWRLFQKTLPACTPEYLAGHSLGEYSALVASGVLKFSDAVSLVATRGALMQSAVPEGEGAMAAIIGLTGDQVKDICTTTSNDVGYVAAVNFNSGVQTVIAGNTNAVEVAMASAKEQGAKRALLLPVSVPSHCDLMKPAAEAFAEKLDMITFGTPNIPVVHNVDVAIHDDPSAIRQALSSQLYQPVRWLESMTLLESKGGSVFVECGPGKALTGLNKRIVSGNCVAAGSLKLFEEVSTVLQEGIEA